MIDALRYLCWGLWVLSLPVAVFLLLPLWMSTGTAIGGSHKNWIGGIVDFAWIFAVPYLLGEWGPNA